MQLRADIVSRTDQMVAACRLDSASIFICDRTHFKPRLSYLYHHGVSEEAQHIYKDEYVFDGDPFTRILAGSDRRGQLIHWEDSRIASAANDARDYRRFINHYGVDVVGAYVQQVLPHLYLVLGVHCRPGAHRKTDVAHGLLEHEIACTSQMVVTQLLEEALAGNAAQRILAVVLAEDGELADSMPRALLSRREREIAELISAGKQNKQVAYSFGLSEFTVENHLRRIYRKLGVHNRAGMVAELLRGQPMQ